jgi:hypothetical protein
MTSTVALPFPISTTINNPHSRAGVTATAPTRIGCSPANPSKPSFLASYQLYTLHCGHPAASASPHHTCALTAYASGWRGVVSAIRRAGSIASPPDYRTALRRLEQLSTTDMLRALDELATLGELEFFRTAVQDAASSRARAAFRAVQIARQCSRSR